jgi:hypothetical protein
MALATSHEAMIVIRTGGCDFDLIVGFAQDHMAGAGWCQAPAADGAWCAEANRAARRYVE